MQQKCHKMLPNGKLQEFMINDELSGRSSGRFINFGSQAGCGSKRRIFGYGELIFYLKTIIHIDIKIKKNIV